MLKDEIIHFLHLPKGERRGILFFFLLIISIRIIPLSFLFFIKQEAADFSEYKETIARFETSVKPNKFDTPKKSKVKKTQYSPPKVVLKNFDPNTANKKELIALGISPKTTNIISNYRAKGGHFFKSEDLLKIYGFEQEDYNRLKPYIQIKKEAKLVKNKAKIVKNKSTIDSLAKPKKTYTYAPKPKPKIIHINQANQEDWESLRGIGPSYASRILKFKKVLGGFHSIDQIKEVYGLPDSTFQAIKPYLKLEKPLVLQKIKINELEADSLVRHPYLRWKQANAIVNYRAMHGAFPDVESIKKIHLISDSLYLKIQPYLAID